VSYASHPNISISDHYPVSAEYEVVVCSPPSTASVCHGIHGEQARVVDHQKATSTFRDILKCIDHPKDDEARAILSSDLTELDFGDIR
jgi:hypothetical protein